MKRKFFITSAQFNENDPNMPDSSIIIEALSDVYNEITEEDTWTHKGNYQLSFWVEEDFSSVIQCNAFVLANPDDPEDSETLDYFYHFDIEVLE